MRTIARETLFKTLFSSQFLSTVDESVKNALYVTAKLDDNDKKYCEEVLTVINNHKDEFKNLIDEKSFAFPEKRIYPADRSILLIALAEILYMDDIPDKVSVNEAANIASKYSSAKSASFITGILSTLIGKKDNV